MNLVKTRLSVNVNKLATLRNARGGDLPNLVTMSLDCERFGAQGITVHPRPDQRHIRYGDVRDLKAALSTELNVEGRPEPSFMDLVMGVQPGQVTLVPDSPGVLTSSEGFNTLKESAWLKEVITRLHGVGIRVSVFVNPDKKMVEGAAHCGADRVELFTGEYARNFLEAQHAGAAGLSALVRPYQEAASLARQLGLGVNAGHDLDRQNLGYLKRSIAELAEVSIGHALVCDALYLGLENTIQLYKTLVN